MTKEEILNKVKSDCFDELFAITIGQSDHSIALCVDHYVELYMELEIMLDELEYDEECQTKKDTIG